MKRFYFVLVFCFFPGPLNPYTDLFGNIPRLVQCDVYTWNQKTCVKLVLNRNCGSDTFLFATFVKVYFETHNTEHGAMPFKLVELVK